MNTLARVMLCGIVLIGVALMAVGQTRNRTKPGGSESEQPSTAWDRVVNQYFDDVYFPFHPTAGTQAGFHRYDRQLED